MIILLKIVFDAEKFEQLKKVSQIADYKGKSVTRRLATFKKVGTVANELLDLVALADNKVGKSAKLIRELVRIFSS